MPDTEFDTTALLWERVADVFAEGAYCQSCPYKVSWIEGYGERLRRCTLLDKDARLRPDECPGTMEIK